MYIVLDICGREGPRFGRACRNSKSGVLDPINGGEMGFNGCWLSGTTLSPTEHFLEARAICLKERRLLSCMDL
jgi:hypothetical protein